MVKIVTDGAIMCCTLGTWQAKLMVLSQSFRSISGALVATEEDKIGLNNIPSFGVCKCSSPNPPCIPQPQGWQQTTQKDSINETANKNYKNDKTNNYITYIACGNK